MSKNKQLKRVALGGLLCLSILGITTSSYADNIRVGRYLSVADSPQADQQQLLQQQIQVKFPQNILTIEQAMQFILQFSGYRLEKTSSMSVLVQSMLKQKLPEVDRNFGPMTLQDALTTLAGDTFYLLIDPVHRLVAFKIKPQYQVLFDRAMIEQL